MRIGKYLVLLILLGVPVLTYLFLKTFGKNFYDLPRFNISEQQSSLVDTNFRSLFTENLFDPRFEGKFSVVHLKQSDCKDSCFQEQMLRLSDYFSGDSSIFLYQLPLDTSKQVQNSQQWKNFILGFDLPEDLKYLETLPPCQRFSLLDRSGEIRGIYDACNQEDIDRLILEIKVLQSQVKK